jgi:5'-3' exonuclease
LPLLNGKARIIRFVTAQSFNPFYRTAMGKVISDEEKNKEAWDSNAITPGTPFMDLLASSLRYWVVQKMNTDPGWKDVRGCLGLEHAFAQSHVLYSFK